MKTGFDLGNATSIQILKIMENLDIDWNECTDWRSDYFDRIKCLIEDDLNLVYSASCCGNALRSMFSTATIPQLEGFLDTGVFMKWKDSWDTHAMTISLIANLLSDIVDTNEGLLLETTAVRIFWAWLRSDLTIQSFTTQIAGIPQNESFSTL